MSIKVILYMMRLCATVNRQIGIWSIDDQFIFNSYTKTNWIYVQLVWLIPLSPPWTDEGLDIKHYPCSLSAKVKTKNVLFTDFCNG